jgi:hypothetical protein
MLINNLYFLKIANCSPGDKNGTRIAEWHEAAHHRPKGPVLGHGIPGGYRDGGHAEQNVRDDQVEEEKVARGSEPEKKQIIS